MRPLEWRKTLGGDAKEWEGGSPLSPPPSGPCGRSPLQRPTRDKPACPITDILVPPGDIGGWGHGEGASGEGRAAARARGRWREGREAKSEGWSGGSGGSDATSDVETEED